MLLREVALPPCKINDNFLSHHYHFLQLCLSMMKDLRVDFLSTKIFILCGETKALSREVVYCLPIGSAIGCHWHIKFALQVM